jgi:phosphate transport system protein
MPIILSEELISLRRAILTMAAEVDQRVEKAIDAMLNHNQAAAWEVRRGDDAIDRMELNIEEECLQCLALAQPVAKDLRFILAIMRINSELERIGDMALSISKRALDLDRHVPIAMPLSLVSMAEETRRMFSNAISALADNDAELALAIRRADSRVDELQKEVFTWVQMEIRREVESTEAAIDVLSVARKLERIADLCTNIAEDIIFLIEGTVVRHSNIR